MWDSIQLYISDINYWIKITVEYILQCNLLIAAQGHWNLGKTHHSNLPKLLFVRDRVY